MLFMQKREKRGFGESDTRHPQASAGRETMHGEKDDERKSATGFPPSFGLSSGCIILTL
jgi:hypothetical protein